MQSEQKMTDDERKPILQDSGIHIRMSGAGRANESGQQYLIIQPVEFDHKHRNLYGYLALGASILVLINYIMIKERTCQFPLSGGLQNYELIQSFHMTALIVSIIVFVLSYFNFAMVIYEFKLLFYAAAALVFICAGLMIYNVVAIASLPCVPLASGFGGLITALSLGPIMNGTTNVFSAGDGIGITVFFFDIMAAGLLFFAGRRFYQKH